MFMANLMWRTKLGSAPALFVSHAMQGDGGDRHHATNLAAGRTI